LKYYGIPSQLETLHSICMQNCGIYIDPFRSKFASQPRDARSIGSDLKHD